jgi:transcriptional regulator of heat shock response
MNVRQQKILEAVIKEYVDTAQSVSSRVLNKKYNLGASPATIRAEMKKLEEQGYLYQPHTSAGRIPTDKGYRFFINSLMKSRELTLQEQKALRQNLLKDMEANRLMPKIANLLADMSSNLAISGLLDFDEPEFYRAGIGRLLREPEFEDSDYFYRVAEILDYLDRNIEELFDLAQDETIGIYIGRENPIRQMRGLSMIVSGQRLKSGNRGLIAILGPRRMRYDRNIALIEYINKLLEEL